jgi:hypothetical protein
MALLSVSTKYEEFMTALKTHLGFLASVLMFVGPVYGWTEWNYTGGSHLWSNPANWTPHVPQGSEDPIIRGQGPGSEALIDANVAAVGHTFWVGYSGRADLNITGGSLTVTAGFRLGQSAGGTANVTISGGTVSVTGDMVVGDSAPGVATLTLSGGTFNHAGGWLYLGYNGATGTININGGSLATSKVVMGTGNPHLNITNGKLIITNLDSAGVANEINGYIAAGKLTFFGGDPRAAHTFTVNGSGFTEITASLPNAQYAWNPGPQPLSAAVSTAAVLTWSPGLGAASHDIYIGTDYTAVLNAARLKTDLNASGTVDVADLSTLFAQWLLAPASGVGTGPDLFADNKINLSDYASLAGDLGKAVPEFKANLASASYTPSLAPDTVYYWRVDEIVNGIKYKGSVWSFTTGPMVAVPSSSALNKYDVLYVNMGTSADFSNPYNPDDIRVDAVFTQPSGANLVVPCFYTSGSSGNSQWQCRFTPRQVGTYSYHMDIYSANVLVSSSPAFTLSVNDSAKDGFLNKNTSSYFTFLFDSGKRFRGIGEDIGWEQGGYMYDRLFPLLHSMNCNYVRVWLANPYDQPLEWSNLGLGIYDETVAAKMDNTLALAAANGIYLTFSMDGCAELDNQATPSNAVINWSKNPYNSLCASMPQFFTSSSAKAQFKKKLRYIIARWGYSPNIAAFEFWNEIDGSWVHFGADRNTVEAWHNEMAPYFKAIDPFDHIVTTSCTGYQDSGFWDMPDIDFSQTHPYKTQLGATLDPANFYNIIVNTYEAAYGKPHVLGEFGYTSGEPTIETHANMVDNLHRGLWAGMFSPTPILPQTWWWDYFERNGDEGQFSSAANFLVEMMRDNAELSTMTVSSSYSLSVLERMGVIAGHDRFVWLRNKSTGTIGSVSFTISGLANGSYTVKTYNTTSGSWSGQSAVSVSSGSLTYSVGSLSANADTAAWIYPNF